MLKILQARLQQYVNCELPDVQDDFRKGRGTRDQIANICWITEEVRESRKTSISATLTTLEPLTSWITTNWKILKETGIPDHLYLSPEKSVCRTRSNSQNRTWNNGVVQTGKRVHHVKPWAG